MKITAVLILIFTSINIFSQSNDEFFSSNAVVKGYGELHFNYKKPDGGEDTRTLDFHRFVLFFGYNFSDKWSFQSEFELEHNFVNEGQGEIALEQAYINYEYNEQLNVKAGVVLNPVGLLNETHEPPTFFGVERPDYQKYIIPTTWFGNGFAISGIYKGLDYSITLMEGLNGDKLTQANILKQGIRSGRQNGFKSNAKSMLINGRVNYTGINGLLLGGSYSHNNAVGDTLNNQIGVLEFHGKIIKNNIYVTAEMANISYLKGNIESSFGYYFDLGYNIASLFKLESKIIPFIRYSNYNTANKTSITSSINQKNDVTKWMIGFNFLPLDNVVIKADYGNSVIKFEDKRTTLFNLGIGYMF